MQSYEVPPYFQEDLFKHVGEKRRPPYRYWNCKEWMAALIMAFYKLSVPEGVCWQLPRPSKVVHHHWLTTWWYHMSLLWF